MSFSSGLRIFSDLQQVLMLGLMVVTMLALYADISLNYKVGIAVFSFTVIFLATLATTILRQQKELHDQRVKEA
jgi:hypothetical protein